MLTFSRQSCPILLPNSKFQKKGPLLNNPLEKTIAIPLAGGFRWKSVVVWLSLFNFIWRCPRRDNSVSVALSFVHHFTNWLKKEIVFEPQSPNLCLPFKSQSLGYNNFVPTLLYFQPRKIGQFVGARICVEKLYFLAFLLIFWAPTHLCQNSCERIFQSWIKHHIFRIYAIFLRLGLQSLMHLWL